MISVFEQRDQLADLERRRQQIAGQAAAPQAPSAAGLTAAAAAGFGAAATALKAADADIAKRRKGRDHDERIGHDLRTDPVTDARGGPEGASADEPEAPKNFRDRGISEGPGEGVEPARPAPENSDRGYVESGHAAESPQAEPPRANPSPIAGLPRGVPVPVALPGARAAPVPAHVTQTLSMGSPSERGAR